MHYELGSNNSTPHAVLDVITTVYDQINDNEYTSMTQLDFKTTFDTVKQSILIKKIGTLPVGM